MKGSCDIMAKKKRITLVNNFNELIENGDMKQLMAVYEKCELHAYDGRYGMNTALHHYGVPASLIRWLVDQGLDVNTLNYYGRTPLYVQSTIGSDIVELLFELGGDIQKPDRYGNTPLHTASEFFHTKTVQFLVEHGADVHAENDWNRTPLAASLACCRNSNISQVAEISSILLDAGTKITSDMIERVKQIGEDFEFHRENFNKQFLLETETGLNKLYQLFGVTPVAKRQIHDGVSHIVVEDAPWKQQYEALWNFLIPSKGPAKTMQGEVIRITGRVQDELYRNGGVNWDRNYRNMLHALLKHFASGVPLSEKELEEAKMLTSSIRAKGADEDSLTERLCELAVLWVLLNPNPIPLEKPNYDR